MVRLFSLILGVIIALAFARLAMVLGSVSGVGQTMEPLNVASCERLDISPGTEDVAIDHETGHAFVSAADRREWYNEGKGGSREAGIFVFDPATLAAPVKVSPDEPADFLPHGISLWRGEDGERRLFAVNHPSTGEELIEIFQIGEDNQLAHLESIAVDGLYSPNDVVAVGPRQFYATNDRRFDRGLAGQIEAYFGLPLTDVIFFDGEAGSVAAQGFAYANGVNVSLDGSRLYVAALLQRNIAVFERDPSTNRLKKVDDIQLPTGPDNIDVDETGALWVAGHTKVFDFLKHAKDAEALAPSHIVRIDPKSGEVRDAFMAVNGEIDAASVGAAHRGRLVVGAVFEGHVLVCPMGNQ